MTRSIVSATQSRTPSQRWLVSASTVSFTLIMSIALFRKQPDPQAIYEALQASAREFVLADSGHAISPPELSIDGNVLYYSLGRINYSRLGLEDNDPYLLPIGTMIRTQALQLAFNQNPLANEFLAGHGERLDSIALSTIRDILATEGNPTAREQALTQRTAQVSEEFAAIDTKIRNYAQRNDLRPQRVARNPAADYYSVQVSTRPPGGIVSVLPWLEYRKHVALRHREDQMPWRTLVQQREDLVGRYVCRIRWTNGQRYAGEFHVRNASPVRLPTR
jgi:hypothetical protein